MVTRVALTDVVQHGANEQKVGSGNHTEELGAVGDGLQQVAIDRVGVERIALRETTHVPPLWKVPTEEVVALERFHCRHERRPGPQQADERTSGALGPGLASLRTAAGQQSQASGADRVASMRCCRSGAEHERLLIHVCIGSQLHLSIDHDDTGHLVGKVMRLATALAYSSLQPVDTPPEPIGGPFH
ncbi:unannotated protein [freshwater metagenome]|uniref:Unannotated protein n=1 Tax=freshwater metagenome TaxID=449393 RepID=A0A6J7C9J2_9ZZZZ